MSIKVAIRGLSVRSKFFLFSLALVVLMGAASGVYLTVQLRSDLESRLEQELLHQARMAAVLLQGETVRSSVALTDRLADELGRATGSRVTLILGDGTVMGDSLLAVEEIAQLDKHGDRLEVRAALRGSEGSAVRFSATLNKRMRYVAVPFPTDSVPGVVRLAMPLDKVGRMVSGMRLTLVVAGLLGLSMALALIMLASRLLNRTLRRLVDHAHHRTHTEDSIPVVTSGDEVGFLSGSVDRMALDLRRTVDQLALERDRRETVLDGMSDAVLTVDQDGLIMMVNPAGLALLELAEPPIGRPFADELAIPELAELVTRARSGTVEQEFSLPPPSTRRVSARATPLQTSGGTVVVLHDITEMRRLETIRQDFVANVSHELRTPISVIQANAETLLDGALADQESAEGFVEAIYRNSGRLTRLVADLLDLSRIEAGKVLMSIEPIVARDAVRRAMEAMEAVVDERDITLTEQLSGDLTVLADNKALDQVLINLLDNAVKYTPNGGHVSVHGSVRGHNARIEIRDDGPGIAAKHRWRIFERFYRVDPGRSRNRGGTGLGLAIVKHLMEKMSGRVGVEPNQPSGSVFWIRLPLDR